MRNRSSGVKMSAAGLLALLLVAPACAGARPQARLTGRSRPTRKAGWKASARQKAGSTITVSVVSDANGEPLPATRLDDGRYALTIKAVGYRLDGSREIEVDAAKPAVADPASRPRGNSPIS